MILRTMSNEKLVDQLGTILIECGLKLDSSEKIAGDYPTRLKAELLRRLNPEPTGDLGELLNDFITRSRGYIPRELVPGFDTQAKKITAAIAALQHQADAAVEIAGNYDDLEAELAELRRDSKRYKFMLLHGYFAGQISDSSPDNGKWWAGKWCGDGPGIEWQTACCDTANKAIDEAIVIMESTDG